MISSKSIQDYEYSTTSSCAANVDITTLFKRYLVSTTPKSGYRFIYIDELQYNWALFTGARRFLNQYGI